MYEKIIVGYDDSEFSSAAFVPGGWMDTEAWRDCSSCAFRILQRRGIHQPAEQREQRFKLGRTLCSIARDSMSAELGLNGNLLAFVCEGSRTRYL